MDDQHQSAAAFTEQGSRIKQTKEPALGTRGHAPAPPPARTAIYDWIDVEFYLDGGGDA